MVFRICLSATLVLLSMLAYAQVDDENYTYEKKFIYRVDDTIYRIKTKMKSAQGVEKPLIKIIVKNTQDRIPHELKLEVQGFGNADIADPNENTVRYDKGTNKSLRIKNINEKTKFIFVYKTTDGFPVNYTQAIFLDGDENFDWYKQTDQSTEYPEVEFNPDMDGAYVLFPTTGLNVPMLVFYPLEAEDNLGANSPVTMEYKPLTKKLLLQYNQAFFDSADLPITVKAKVN